MILTGNFRLCVSSMDRSLIALAPTPSRDATMTTMPGSPGAIQKSPAQSGIETASQSTSSTSIQGGTTGLLVYSVPEERQLFVIPRPNIQDLSFSPKGTFLFVWVRPGKPTSNCHSNTV